MKRKHHDLVAWQEAMRLVKGVYGLTTEFPGHELYGLTSQMRRAAVSIPSNIAEGAARTGRREFLRFLSITRGSLSELETQFLIAEGLGYTTDCGGLMEQIDRVFSLVGGLMKSLRQRTERRGEG